MSTTLSPLFLPLILGTNREGRYSERIATFLLKRMKAHPEIETQLFDPRDFALPRIGYGEAIRDQFPEFCDAIQRADGLVIVSPEYNHAYPGVLKWMLDLLDEECTHKPVALVGVSSGAWGGTRVIEAILPVLRTLGFVSTAIDLNIPNVEATFSADGMPLDPAYESRADKFLTELVWMAKVLKAGRQDDSAA